MDVDKSSERLFYEIEAEKEHWEVKQLERYIHSFLFARLLKSQDKNSVMALAREGQALQKPADVMKNPYIHTLWIFSEFPNGTTRMVPSQEWCQASKKSRCARA